MRLVFCMIIISVSATVAAQNKPYYYEIPEAPVAYTPATVAARMVDGLGFRYYWATEGLTAKDLNFKPSDSARTLFETLEHIKGLTDVLMKTTGKETVTSGGNNEKLSFEELRTLTLKNIQTASDLLKKADVNLEDMNMVFERANGKTEFPFWNLINGPISDALWHVGQVVTFRRSAGNPLPPGVNVLTGKKN